MEKKIGGLDVIKEEQEETYAEVKERCDKLTQIGAHYGIKLDHNGNLIYNKKQIALKKRYDELKKQEKTIKSEIGNIEKHGRIDMKERKKQLRGLTLKKDRTGKEILEKIGDIRRKAIELGDLIEKMKQYDIGEEILLKWQTENEKMLKKLDQDEKNALEVTEMTPQNRLPPKG